MEGEREEEGPRAIKTYNINNENPRVPRTTYATNTGTIYGKGRTKFPGQCRTIEVFNSLIYAFGGCLPGERAASCFADYGSILFRRRMVSFLGGTERQVEGGGRYLQYPRSHPRG